MKSEARMGTAVNVKESERKEGKKLFKFFRQLCFASTF